MLSIIIPAHNEQAVIRRCLTALLSGAAPGELEVIVVCNAYSDWIANVTVEIVAARSLGDLWRRRSSLRISTAMSGTVTALLREEASATAR